MSVPSSVARPPSKLSIEEVALRLHGTLGRNGRQFMLGFDEGCLFAAREADFDELETLVGFDLWKALSQFNFPSQAANALAAALGHDDASALFGDRAVTEGRLLGFQAGACEVYEEVMPLLDALSEKSA